MTVTGSFNYDIRPYAGHADPSLPIASYLAQGGLVGDASGGTVSFTFVFMGEQETKITELFNLEQFEVDTNSTTPRIATLETVNMDSLSRNRSASKRKWQAATISGSVGESALSLEQSTFRPLWLGSPNLDARAGTAGLRVSFVNIVTLLFSVTIQGYIWSSRSILAAGGPQRPVGGGLFGA